MRFVNDNIIKSRDLHYRVETKKKLLAKMSEFQYDFIMYYINNHCDRNNFTRRNIKDLKYIIDRFINIVYTCNLFEANVADRFNRIMCGVLK